MQRQIGYFDQRGHPTALMQLLWQRHCEALEEFATRISQQVNDNSNLLAQILTTTRIAQAARTEAVAVEATTSLAISYTDPVSVLMADSAGNVTVAAHIRRYSNGASVSVNGGSVSGFASGNYVTVYYIDAGREGGAVTYQATTAAISQEGNTHIVGSVFIPAAGEPPASGAGSSAPGYIPPPGFNPPYIEP